jgi:hypothetical protein
MSAAAYAALCEAARALETLTTDIRLSGLQQRQRTPIARIREKLDTVCWLLDYDAATCNHAGAKNNA